MDESLSRYYQFHARIYDVTRWSFLFGRRQLISMIPDCIPKEKKLQHILEVGCGTGYNLIRLSESFPDAVITGLDLSADMLDQCREKVERHRLGNAGRIRLKQVNYCRPLCPRVRYDLVLFSYSLSMINPGWANVVQSAAADMAPGGLMAAVDFHDASAGLFRKWMSLNHVKMEAHLLPELKKWFPPVYEEIHWAYAGLWRYFLVIGRKPSI